MNNNNNPFIKEKLTWKESNSNDFGNSLEDILAEFQALGLKSLGSTPIVESGLKIGKKTNSSAKFQDVTLSLVLY